MNKQILSLLLIISLAGAAIYYLLTQPSDNFGQTTLLFSDLSDKADSIERIEVLNHHGNLLTATRGIDGWVTRIETIGADYPVDQGKLSKLVSSLIEAKIFEAKTAKKENYTKLGISDIQSEDSQATLVNLYSKGTQYSVLIGSQASSGQGSYVRRNTEQQSWLLDTIIDIPDSEFEWLKQPITNIVKGSITTIAREDDQNYTVKKREAEKVGFELANLKQGEMLKYESIVDGFVDNIVNLEFDEIVSMPDSFWLPSDAEPEKKIIPFSIAIENADSISMTLALSNNEHFVRFVKNSAGGHSHWDGFTYSISSFSFGQIDKSRDSFIDTTEIPEIVAPVTPAQAIDEGESPN